VDTVRPKAGTDAKRGAETPAYKVRIPPCRARSRSIPPTPAAAPPLGAIAATARDPLGAIAAKRGPGATRALGLSTHGSECLVRVDEEDITVAVVAAEDGTRDGRPHCPGGCQRCPHRGSLGEIGIRALAAGDRRQLSAATGPRRIAVEGARGPTLEGGGEAPGGEVDGEAAAAGIRASEGADAELACILTLIRSSGCPTTTLQNPPTAPGANSSAPELVRKRGRLGQQSRRLERLRLFPLFRGFRAERGVYC
jgi:hypothetical protein